MTKVSGREGERHSKNAAFVREVTDINVGMAVAQATERSPVLAERARNGELMVVVAV